MSGPLYDGGMTGRASVPPFVHLHLHTHYSLLDATIQIPKLVEQVASMGMPAVAITDHGTLFGAFQFHQKAVAAGLRPVIGCEVYVARGDHRDKSPVRGRKNTYNHLVLLAENQAGWRNLCRLVSAGYLEGFYYKPRISKALLAEHSEGLIGLSACLSGEIQELLLDGDLDGAVRVAEEYREILGKDGFFLEIQDHGSKDEEVVREGLVTVSQRTGLPLVATNDTHFHSREDLFAHRVLIAIGRNLTLEELQNRYPYNAEFHLKSPEAMYELFREYPGACERTVEIAERCHVMFDTGTLHLPSYPVPKGFTLDTYLRKVAEEGLQRRLAVPGNRRAADAAYRERLERELGIISRMGFPGYFLVVWDFIEHARQSGVPVGPGRGSAAGSVVSWALGITNIDPLEHDLLFERFLNPERISMPDIDIDFCQRGREKVIQYVRERYGEDSVCQIATFNVLKARSAIRDVGRVMGLSFGEVDQIAKLVPEELNITIERALEESPRLREMVEGDEAVRRVVDTAARIEGLARHCGVHAAGVVIAPEPLVNLVPLYRTSHDEVTTQFDKDDVEQLGLLKMDFLGLRTLTVISDALASIEAAGEEPPDLERIPFDDPKVYELFAAGDTDGVFQFESSGMKDMLRKVEPRQFADLSALNALYRPGPMQFIDDYAGRKAGKKRVTYIFPELEEILGETYGIMVYQEQVMRIAVVIAGFSMAKADTLRKAMAKKKQQLIEKLGKEFIEGGVARGYPEDKVRALWEQIGPFAQYGFNKSHSVAYAHIAYLTAYLKVHYPAHFMASMLTSEVNNTDKLVQYIDRTRKMGMAILPPDINRSSRPFTVEEGSIRFGLEAIKGVGASAVETIIAVREQEGPFTSFSQFLRSLPGRAVNGKVVECLVKAGCFDSLGLPRKPLLDSLDHLMDMAAREREQQALGQAFLFADLPSESAEAEVREGVEAERDTLLQWEREVLGFYLSGHPLERFREQIDCFADTKVTELPSRRAEEWEKVTVAGIVTGLQERRTRAESRQPGRRWAKFRLEDTTGTAGVLVFPDAWDRYGATLEEDRPVLVTGALRGPEDEVEIVADEIVPLEGIERRRAAALRIVLLLDEENEERLRELRELLLEHGGSIPVRFELVRRGRFRATLVPPAPLAVEPSEALIRALRERLGPGRVELELAPNGGGTVRLEADSLVN